VKEPMKYNKKNYEDGWEPQKSYRQKKKYNAYKKTRKTSYAR